jgi:hypothetical protein
MDEVFYSHEALNYDKATDCSYFELRSEETKKLSLREEEG